MPLPEDDDKSGEVISLNGTPTGTGSLPGHGDEDEDLSLLDRGDNLDGLTPTPTPAALPAPTPTPTPTPTPAPAAATPAAPTGPSPAVPLARFNEVNNEKKALIEENERLQRLITQQQATPTPGATPAPTPAPAATFNIDAKEQEYIDLLMEGDTKGALDVRKQINAELQRQAETVFETRQAQQEQQTTLATVAQQAFVSYPFLNDQGAAANTAAINDVVEWREFYTAKGHEPHEALQLAVDKVGPLYANLAPTPAAPNPGAERNAAAIAAAAAASAAQPSHLPGIGNRASGAAPDDVMEMSEEKFEAMSKEEKARLRGDAL
jgi:hypothetical protein